MTKPLTETQYERLLAKLSTLGFLDYGSHERTVDGDGVYFSMGGYAGWNLRSVRDINEALDDMREVRALVRADMRAAQ